jgi:tetratricopeptide (TPR) repeat protein
MISRFRLGTLVMAALAVSIATATAQETQEHGHAAPAGVGTLVFPISCNAEAQSRFEHALALLHSFWYEEAEPAFLGVAEADPGCAMAYWGVAMSRLHPLWFPPSEADLRTGLEAVERASALGAPTRRERDYVAAIGVFYRDPERLDHRTRLLAYEKSMQALHERYPEDVEAAIFHALAIRANAAPTDTTFERHRRAASILEPLFERYPNHPGLAHYIIHAYDAPPLASSAVEAARRYAQIAPAVPHARHMPSHVFILLGMWDESIASNLSSAEAALNFEQAQGKGVWDQRLHAMDYLIYAYLQQGRDAAARRIVEEAGRVIEFFPAASLVGDHALVAIPARYALERGRWAEAAELPVRRRSSGPATETITRFARAIGAARSGDVELARVEVAALSALEDELAKRKESYDWARVAEFQRLAAAAWLARADGDTAGALRLAAEAAELEEATEKHPVTPGWILPARELQGDLLLELDRPAEALEAFEAALAKQPNRARSVFGAARAAELAGDPESAGRWYSGLVELMARADAERAEPQVGKAFLAKGGAGER